MTNAINTDLQSQIEQALDLAMKKSDLTFIPEYEEKKGFTLKYRYFRPRFRWPKLNFMPKNKILKAIFFKCQQENIFENATLEGMSSMAKKDKEGGD